MWRLFGAADETDYEDEDDISGDEVEELKEKLKDLNAVWQSALFEIYFRIPAERA